MSVRLLLGSTHDRAGTTVTTVLQFLRDLMLAFLAPRAVLIAESLLLRQQVVVLRRQVKLPRIRPFDRWLLTTPAGRFRDRRQSHGRTVGSR